MQSERWYPTIETLQDGSLIIVSAALLFSSSCLSFGLPSTCGAN
jgi:hypothetical protein